MEVRQATSIAEVKSPSRGAELPTVHGIALLGYCDRFERVHPKGEMFPFTNAINLRGTDVFPIFPLCLRNLFLVFAINKSAVFNRYRMELKDSSGSPVMNLTLGLEHATSTPGVPLREQDFLRDWELFAVPFPDEVVISKPDLYVLWVTLGEEVAPLGTLKFMSADWPQLTGDEIEAIKSDPLSAKWIVFEVGCRFCSDKLSVYGGISGRADKGTERGIWYQDLEPTFRCQCGKTVVDTVYLRRNFHVLFAMNAASKPAILGFDLTRRYEDAAVKETLAQFVNIIDREPAEQEIHEFLRANKILFAQFSPRRIFDKPRIQDEIADFGIVTNRNELLLVEIERPSCRLLKSDGGLHSELQAALTQARSWRTKVEDHRHAVLQMLGLKNEEVRGIREVVIAGRRDKRLPGQLRSLMDDRLGGIHFQTYDDLFDGLLLQAGFWEKL